MGNNDTKLSPTNILNRSYDPSFDAIVVEAMEFDGSALKRGLSSLMAVQIDTSAAPVIYIGKAPIGTATSAAAWIIKKLDTTSGVSITWAGSGNPTQIWDNRTGLSYA